MHLPGVVPAKAGTEPPALVFAKGVCHFAKSRSRGLWVPAFAGTTWEG